MLGTTLIGDQVVQVREPRQKRLLTAGWMVKRFHHEQFPVDGMMSLIQQGAGGRHLRVFEDGIPTRYFVLKPLSHALAVGLPCGVGDVIGKAA